MDNEYNGLPLSSTSKSRRHTLSASADPKVRVRDVFGGVLRLQLFPAALAVTRGAQLLDEEGKKILPTQVVVCKKKTRRVGVELRAGQLVEVLDPGVESYLRKDAPKSELILAKSLCRDVGACRENEIEAVTCEGCFNNNNQKGQLEI